MNSEATAGETGDKIGGAPAASPTVVVISGTTMGTGDDDLGRVLMRNFVRTLAEADPRPDTLILLNSGVMLAVEGSPALDDLKELAYRGVDILACGTCLNHFEVKERLAAGEVSNMFTITEIMLEAGKVINF